VPAGHSRHTERAEFLRDEKEPADLARSSSSWCAFDASVSGMRAWTVVRKRPAM
jgi:hypothetical protein